MPLPPQRIDGRNLFLCALCGRLWRGADNLVMKLLAVGLIVLAGIFTLGTPSRVAAAKPGKKPETKKPEPDKPVVVVTLTDEVRAERTDAAMKKAINFLYSQNRNGNWESAQARDPADPKNSPNGKQWTGLTALTVYALISAGESAGDKRIASAIDFLMTHPSEGVYASTCRCLVWSRLAQTPPVHAAGQRDVDLILSAVRTKGVANGLLYYSPFKPGDDPKSEDAYDHSVSQMGALGLSVMVPLGYEVPQKFWVQTEQAWQNHQYADGAWSYVFNAPKGSWGMHTATMTGAGVATLFITQNFLSTSNECTGDAHDRHIDNGVNWLAKNFAATFDVSREVSDSHYEGYALFGISRVGVASGLRYFGRVDWLEEGADYLIAAQEPNGSWKDTGPAGTPFSLLFLVYGSAPVVFDKLEYTLPAPAGAQWNQRPQDLLNFVDWMGHRLETRLNWQVVNFSSPAAALHDAPILVIEGSNPLNFTDAERAKLRRFVEDGGMILGNADCDKKEFTDSFIKLGPQLFPYEFRELPPGHLIYTNEQYRAAKFQRPPHVLGLSNGVRELMLLPEEDVSRALQHRNDALRPDVYQLLADIALYAMDTSGLQRKGKTYLVNENPAAPIDRTIKLARLQYGGDWNPEPGGWRRLTAVLHNTEKIALQVEAVKLGDGKLTDPIAHLTGTAAFKLTDAQREDLKRYVQGGGTLIIDAAGGSTAFAASVDQMLQDVFGADAKQLDSPLELSSAVYQRPGHVVQEVQYRQFAQRRLGNSRTPRLDGIKIGGRLAVIYSREDLSAGLVGEPVDGIMGYSPASATELMTDILVTSLAK